jgi:hypothetical protein
MGLESPKAGLDVVANTEVTTAGDRNPVIYHVMGIKHYKSKMAYAKFLIELCLKKEKTEHFLQALQINIAKCFIFRFTFCV